jgi:hypothetical protein
MCTTPVHTDAITRALEPPLEFRFITACEESIIIRLRRAHQKTSDNRGTSGLQIVLLYCAQRVFGRSGGNKVVVYVVCFLVSRRRVL